MIYDELKYRICEALGHVPTHDQERAVDVFCHFLLDRSDHVAMVLRGSAGTGKTTVAAAIVRALTALRQKLVLLAPTGRAAKVFSLYAGQAAFTIHRRIYRQRTAGDVASSFSLNDNLYRDTLFVVDEASMIAATVQGDTFGSGSLLDDLVRYVRSGHNCRMLLIGDKAQLPPVGEEEAPALTTAVLQGYGLRTYECDLGEVLRQSQESGILRNATAIRQLITHDEMTQLPRMQLRGFADITVVPGDELIESLASSYSRVGVDETIVITRSNKRCNIYNQGIRRTVLDRDDELCRGDQLMVVRNNYFWGQGARGKNEGQGARGKNEGQGARGKGQEARGKSEEQGARGKCEEQGAGGKEQESGPAFLANGDRCVVQRVRNVRELYGFRFADVTLQMPDYEDFELQATALLDALTSEAPALTREQQDLLYNKVMEDYADIPLKSERIKKLKGDAYYNALQIKFGYAVTCHKAQGGQWAHVYIDQGYMTDDMLSPDYVHWLYTALTRATEHVFLVNWPGTQIA